MEGRIWQQALEISADDDASPEDSVTTIFAKLHKTAKDRKQILRVIFFFWFYHPVESSSEPVQNACYTATADSGESGPR
jgi:hypothetical protein